MKKLTTTLITLSMGMVMSSAVQSASSGNLSVIGTIKPATCITTIGGVADATFDYGKIAPSRLQQSAMTPLEVKTLPLKIQCDGDTKLAVTAVDNKLGTNPFTTGTVNSTDAGEGPTQPAKYLYGLGSYGAAADKHIGAYSLAVSAATAKIDNVQAFMAFSGDNGAIWTETVNGQLGGDNSWRTWTAASGSKVPAQGKLFEVDLMVKPWIQPRSALDLSSNIVLAGSATVEVYYL
ncbi:DUF1120 domain-containing protein [Enterobacter mori]|uniref:DUF1120 domain-containing protein n=1 Tax=Enterobacter mori TaxID=539813 RepID=UPI001B8D7FE1|nr:DUF1120 domain-containing protein [Enterobacter mori]MBS3046408.1 DUF1120 domain-containing protein [Enterobacter mori]